jgi:hypothetical protein
MSIDPVSDILQQYLQGTLEVGEAADALMSSWGGRPGFSIAMQGMDEDQRERVDALMGRLMWLTLRSQDPNAVPETPFDGARFRAMREQLERELGSGD